MIKTISPDPAAEGDTPEKPGRPGEGPLLREGPSLRPVYGKNCSVPVFQASPDTGSIKSGETLFCKHEKGHLSANTALVRMADGKTGSRDGNGATGIRAVHVRKQQEVYAGSAGGHSPVTDGGSGTGWVWEDRFVQHGDDMSAMEAYAPPGGIRALSPPGGIEGRAYGHNVVDADFREVRKTCPLAEYNDPAGTETDSALETIRCRARQRAAGRMTGWRLAGWISWLLTVAGITVSAFLYRHDIVRTVPPAAAVYAMAGIPVHAGSPVISDVRHYMEMTGYGPVIMISGHLGNLPAGKTGKSVMQAEAVGDDGKTMARWTFETQEPVTRNGNTANFQTRSPVPEGTRKITISLVPRG